MKHPLDGRSKAAAFPGPAGSDRVASIDVGTNTILLLVAELDGDRLRPLLELETVVRLGEGIERSGSLSREAMERGIDVLRQYASRCLEMGVSRVFAVGTSALREARNRDDFVRLVREKVNLSIDVVHEDEEAELSFLGVAIDQADRGGEILAVDIGGGSTEVALGQDLKVDRWISLPIGSVRLTEKYLLSDPVREEEWERMIEEIHNYLAGIPRPEGDFTVVAVGGTATTLASVEQGLDNFLPERIHNFELTMEALSKQLLLYRSKNIHERRKIPGLSPARADVIIAGGAILLETMKKLRTSAVKISCHGLRYGLLYKNTGLSLRGRVLINPVQREAS